MNPVNSSTKENIYLKLINECHKEVEEISLRIGIMCGPTSKVALQEESTPSRTELESQLQNLRSHLIELKSNIYS